MYPWQQQMFDRITAGGFKPGEMIVMTAGRRTGKSQMTQQAIDRLMRDLNSRPIEELVLSEGRIYGARYHCVEPIGGNWREMEDWCIRTYGEVGSVWRADKWIEEPAQRWYANDRKFWFRREADCTMFVLKWR
jgi:hypothetical protein